jgi:ABC-type uncharacterized transport system substrate-binding protein
MDELSVFINLKSDTETDARLKVLTDILGNVVHMPPVFGAGQFGPHDQNYTKKVADLIAGNANAKYFFAPCWPSLRELSGQINNSQVIVFAGVVSATGYIFPDRCTGLAAFSIGDLCPSWPSLLLQATSLLPAKTPMTKLAIVYDSSHAATVEQFDTLQTAATKLGITDITPIYADAANAPNNNIATAIQNFASTAGPAAGLIVTACTMPGVLCDQITKAAKGLIAIYPSDMYILRTNPPGLMSYGPSVLDLYKKAATDYVQKLLGGSDWKQTGTNTNQDFNLIVNRKVASDLKLNIQPGTQFEVADLTNGGTKKITPTFDPPWTK